MYYSLYWKSSSSIRWRTWQKFRGPGIAEDFIGCVVLRGQGRHVWGIANQCQRVATSTGNLIHRPRGEVLNWSRIQFRVHFTQPKLAALVLAPGPQHVPILAISIDCQDMRFTASYGADLDSEQTWDLSRNGDIRGLHLSHSCILKDWEVVVDIFTQLA